MINKELLEWIHTQSEKLIVKYGHVSTTERERVYARALKLNEEVGELCEEILAMNGDQRQEKLDAKNKDNLAHEVADVLICTLLLAKSLGIDPNTALENKIRKINERFADVRRVE